MPIKYVADVLSAPLAYIINLSFSTGIFPDKLKIARVCPIFKGGNPKHMTNYRPISVLPVLSKVYESTLNERLQDFFDKYTVINNARFGFQKNKSAELALLQIKDHIIGNFEKKIIYSWAIHRSAQSVRYRMS